MIASSKGTSRSQISNMAVIQMRLGILHVDLTSEGGVANGDRAKQGSTRRAALFF
jgi:hypothetical protein